MAENEDWSSKEVALAVTDYFSMLQQELQGLSYNKTEHRKNLIPKLDGRNASSVEFKHQNISAVLAKLGMPYIKGYKPKANYQELLVDGVTSFVKKHKDRLEPLFERFVEGGTPKTTLVDIDFAHCLNPAPAQTERSVADKRFRAVKINYLEKEQRNRIIGSNGEKFVIDYEKWRLAKEGRSDLIEHIEWTSLDKGDGTGYDILSKNVDGSDRYIEVKTTQLSNVSPIYLTATEVAFAQKYSDQFYLYRVYDFNKHPKLFILQGDYEKFCRLEASAYRGIF